MLLALSWPVEQVALCPTHINIMLPKPQLVTTSAVTYIFTCLSYSTNEDEYYEYITGNEDLSESVEVKRSNKSLLDFIEERQLARNLTASGQDTCLHKIKEKAASKGMSTNSYLGKSDQHTSDTIKYKYYLYRISGMLQFSHNLLKQGLVTLLHVF